MFYYNKSLESLVKLIEINCDKSDFFKATTFFTFYSSGLVVYKSYTVCKYIFNNGDTYILSEPFPIDAKIEKTFEIEWFEYAMKDDLIELLNIKMGMPSVGCKVIFRNEEFVAYAKKISSMQFKLGKITSGSKYYGTVIETNDNESNLILREIYKNYKLVEFVSESFEKTLIKLLSTIK